MGLGVITTDTTHHLWWVWKLAEAGVLDAVVLEQRIVHPPFDTYHPFENERDAYERDVMLGDCPAQIDGFAPTTQVERVNDPGTVAALADCELVIVFGTGLIREPVLTALEGRLLNLHGGDPERYRGLDTHLWCIYHRDFSALVTTLHVVAPRLDAGAIVSAAPIPLTRESHLHELRSRNTEICLDLALAAAALPDGPRTRQRAAGRYYSYMPSVLKEVCVKHFAEHVATL